VLLQWPSLVRTDVIPDPKGAEIGYRLGSAGDFDPVFNTRLELLDLAQGRVLVSHEIAQFLVPVTGTISSIVCGRIPMGS
jgi:hypothetical protein